MRSRARIGGGMLGVGLWVAAGVISAVALEREDLSANAQKLLPQGELVTVVFNNGSEEVGTLLERNAERILLEQRTRSITRRREYEMADIRRINPMDVSNAFAQGLASLQITTQTMPLPYVETCIEVLEEFLRLCAGHEYEPTAKQQLALFQQEKRGIERGMQKIEGQWYSPVAAAVKRFDMYDDAMERLESQFSGISAAGYQGNAAAKRRYDQLRLAQRDVARELPQLLNQRIPTLLQEEVYDEAIEEADAFQKFWMGRVVDAETSGGARGGVGRAELLAQMDMNFVPRMQNRIMEAYNASGEGMEIPDDPPTEEGMVYIPGGFFLMGNNDSRLGDDTFPPHIVYVAPFLLDKHEVTNEEYREFVDHVTRTGDASMAHPEAPPLKDHSADGWRAGDLGEARKPVVGVDWFDAYAYLTWKGKRMPTEAEWERAARGSDGRRYPWGNQSPSQVFANNRTGRDALAAEITRQETPRDRRGGDEPPPPVQLPETTWPVDKLYPDRAELIDLSLVQRPENPFGLMHMAGNAAEWVSDWYSADYYLNSPVRNPRGPNTGTRHIYRGGSYRDDDGACTTFSRGATPDSQGGQQPGGDQSGGPFIGIRGAKSLNIVR